MMYSMDDLKEIWEFAEEVCDILDIDVPVIRPATKQEIKTVKATNTMKAASTPDGKQIILFQKAEKLDLFFALAHELRHSWQMQKRPELYDGYLPSSKLDSDTYNLQPAELDANAFAVCVMATFFRLRPMFNGLAEDTVNRILEEAARIAGA